MSYVEEKLRRRLLRRLSRAPGYATDIANGVGIHARRAQRLLAKLTKEGLVRTSFESMGKDVRGIRVRYELTKQGRLTL